MNLYYIDFQNVGFNLQGQDHRSIVNIKDV